MPSSAAAAAPTAPSAAWTLLFRDSLLLVGASSALLATPLQARARADERACPHAAMQGARRTRQHLLRAGADSLFYLS